ncbi:MAG TPA: DUF4157 domain-containing protein [Chloroflexota bacterium]
MNVVRAHDPNALRLLTDDPAEMLVLAADWAGRLAGARPLATMLDPGEPLPETEREELPPLAGGDPPPDVRIHRDEASARAADELRADAFAVGRHVFFGQGRFAPETRAGRALLAHELVHARQQTGPGRALQRQDGAEAEARAAERAVLAERPEGPAGGLSVGTYRRVYATADGGALTPAEHERLDAISLRALAVARDQLGPAPGGAGRWTIPRLEVDLELDLGAASDEEAAERWGRVLADTLRRQIATTEPEEKT